MKMPNQINTQSNDLYDQNIPSRIDHFLGRGILAICDFILILFSLQQTMMF